MISFKKRTTERRQEIILDTCALIDGRIVAVAKAGFVPQRMLVPQFVIAELQYLADHGDSHKRERARYGLDVIRELQGLRRADVIIAREQFPNIKEVDDKLIALAKQYGAMLYTIDYNLNKVAQIEGVSVLNVNELAQALRPHRLPGERIELKITQVGQDRSQGVGYLDDGTMVVVERAGNKVGQRVDVEFSRMLQTQAGKMMFAVLPDGGAITQPAAPVAQQPQKSARPRQQRQLAVQPLQTVGVQQPRALHPAAQPVLEPKVDAMPQHPTVKSPLDDGTLDQRQQPSRRRRRNRHHRGKSKATSPEDALLNAIARTQS